MRKSFFTLLLLLIGASVCGAQSSAKQGESTSPNAKRQAPDSTAPPLMLVYTLGKQVVAIPTPEGFEEGSSQIPFLKRFFEATEAPDLDFLAAHLPTEVLEKVRNGKPPEMKFYTKVSVAKNLREVNTSEKFFSQLVAYMSANLTKLIDLNTPAMRSLLKNNNKNISELLERDAKMDLSKPVNLGEIEKTPNSYGFLLLMKYNSQIDGVQKEVVMIASTSIVRIKERLIWVYVYHRFNAPEDIATVKNFTKQWAGQIVSANAH